MPLGEDEETLQGLTGGAPRRLGALASPATALGVSQGAFLGHSWLLPFYLQQLTGWTLSQMSPKPPDQVPHGPKGVNA